MEVGKILNKVVFGME